MCFTGHAHAHLVKLAVSRMRLLVWTSPTGGSLVPYYLNENDGWSMNIKDLRQRVDTARSQGLAVGQGTCTSCAGHKYICPVMRNCASTVERHICWVTQGLTGWSVVQHCPQADLGYRHRLNNTTHLRPLLGTFQQPCRPVTLCL